MEYFIYLIQCNEFYKIGISRDVQFRLRELQVANPYKLILADCFLFRFKGTILVEQRLHKQFRARRVSGEWFKLSEKEGEQFAFLCEKWGGVRANDVIDYVSTPKTKPAPTPLPKRGSLSKKKKVHKRLPISDIRALCAEDSPVVIGTSSKFDFAQMIRDGWRIEIRDGGRTWMWRRGSGKYRPSVYGGTIDTLPEEFR